MAWGPPSREHGGRSRGCSAIRPPGALLADGAVRALGRVVGHDGYCLFGVDPATGLRSVMFSRHGLTVPTEVLLHNETVDRDANRYVDLARAPVPAAALTPHDTPRSRRLHEILPADGYRSELRLALVTPGHYWGALSLFRDDPRRPFTDTDVDARHALAPPLGDVLRRYQVGRPRDRPARRPMTGGVGLPRRARRRRRAWTTTPAPGWPASPTSGHDGVVPEDVLRCVHEVAGGAHDGGGPGRSPGRGSPTAGWLVASGTHVGGSDVDVVVQLRSGDVGTVLPAFADVVRAAPTARPTSCGCSSRAWPPSRSPVGSASRCSPSATTSARSTARPGVRGRDELLSLLV